MVEAHGGNLAERIDASRWQIELPGVAAAELRAAVEAFLAAPEVLVERMTKQGMRTFDARGAVVWMSVRYQILRSPDRHWLIRCLPGSILVRCAILDLVIRLVSPTVRPDDVLSGLRVVAALEPPVPARATRLAQGTLTAAGDLVDPLLADRGGNAMERSTEYPAG